MKNIFSIGDVKIYNKQVNDLDIAAFHGEIVHGVCSTFSLARDMEWSSRLFVLEMRDSDEEGIGTFIHIDHKSPAFVGESLDFIAKVNRIEQNEIVCDIEVRTAGRLIATGQTGQKILKREKLAVLFAKK